MTPSDYDLAIDVLRSGDRTRLEELAVLLVAFPDGVDSFLGRRWILNAIDIGTRSAIEWMLEKQVDLAFRDEEGYTPLLTVIDSKRHDRYELLELLLRAGAPVDLKGINDWTPAHLAAARDDVAALRILVAHGADLTIRTDIDDCATPLEEARTLGSRNAVAFLEVSGRGDP
jgi:ankyrin repeat protein